MGILDNENGTAIAVDGQTGDGVTPVPVYTPAAPDASPDSGRADEYFHDLNPVQQSMAVKTGLVSKGDYFTHDNKLYQRKDGSTYLVTGDPMGDVKLDDEQTAQLDKARGENRSATGPHPEPSGGKLVAGNGDLCHYDANGNLIAMYPYTSGVEGITDPSASYKGPIPPGEYSFNTDNIDEVHGLRYLKRRISGDWGNYRVPLEPSPGTETYGRNNFFIHGGDTPGSLGCIDVGKNDKYLFPSLRAQGGTMRLTVK